MFNTAERPLAIYAHPDDEVIGATYAMKECSEDLSLVFATDGAPSIENSPEYYYPVSHYQYGQEYINLRRQEAKNVAAILGLKRPLKFMGLTDSMLHLQIPQLVNGIRKVIEDVNPDLIITHAYEGGHLDHDLVVAAIWKILSETQRDIIVCETPLYSKDGERITHNQRINRHSSWQTLSVTPDPQKARAMTAYASQQIDLQYFDPQVLEHYHFQSQPQFASMRELPNCEATLYGKEFHSFILQLLQE